GIVPAKVGGAIFDDQPPAALAAARVGEPEMNDYAPVAREFLEARETADVPHQEPRVQLLGLQPAADPARTPVTEGEDDRAELFPGGGRMVFPALLAAAPLDDAHFLELPQPLGEQG